MRRAVAALAVAALVGALLAPTASAHEDIVSTNPSGIAKTSLRSVVVNFNGPIRSGTLKVFGPDGSKVSKGKGGRDPRDVTRLRVALQGGLAPGRYTAKVTWVAADGHHQDATLGFRLKR
jgi:methionine-rich copper-binding protein CopC